MKKRRRFTPEFKAKVVLDVLTGASLWPRRAASTPSARTCWASGRPRSWSGRTRCCQPDEQRDEDQARIAELEQLLGRATRQIEILKKASTLLDATSTKNGK